MKIMNKRKTILLLTAVMLLLAATVGGTITYLHTHTGTVVNTFEPSSVVPKIEETFTNNTIKTNVWLWNNGTVDAYLRATVVVNWKNGNNVIPAKENVDYTITFNTGEGSKWTNVSGIYYYADKISPSTSAPGRVGYTDGTKIYTTDVLVSECKQTGNPPADGYKLNVEILAQAIQAEGITGATGAQDAWTKAAQ